MMMQQYRMMMQQPMGPPQMGPNGQMMPPQQQGSMFSSITEFVGKITPTRAKTAWSYMPKWPGPWTFVWLWLLFCFIREWRAFRRARQGFGPTQLQPGQQHWRTACKTEGR